MVQLIQIANFAGITLLVGRVAPPRAMLGIIVGAGVLFAITLFGLTVGPDTPSPTRGPALFTALIILGTGAVTSAVVFGGRTERTAGE